MTIQLPQLSKENGLLAFGKDNDFERSMFPAS